jgi:hypothetical protein
MLSAPLVVGVSFAVPAAAVCGGRLGDRRAAQGRSLIDNAWVYALSMAVYCTAWTYFGSVGRAAGAGVWFLPIYLGPTLAMVLGWFLLRKMIRISRSLPHHLDRRLDRQPLRQEPDCWAGWSPDHGGGHRPLHRAAAQGDRQRLRAADRASGAPPLPQRAWWNDSTLYFALALAGFTMVFGTRHLDNTERHEGMVAAIAFESMVKLLAFLAVGVFVTWGLFDRAHRRACPGGAGTGGADAPGRSGRVCLRPVVRADAAGAAVGDLPAAAVPDHGGGERG